MERERLEKQLQYYFQAEVQKVEPSPEWWNKIITTKSSPAPEPYLPFSVNVSTAPAHLPGEQIMFGIGITNLPSGTITIDPFSPAKW